LIILSDIKEIISSKNILQFLLFYQIFSLNANVCFDSPPHHPHPRSLRSLPPLIILTPARFARFPLSIFCKKWRGGQGVRLFLQKMERGPGGEAVSVLIKRRPEATGGEMKKFFKNYPERRKRIEN